MKCNFVYGDTMNHIEISKRAFEILKPSIKSLLKEEARREDMHIVVMNPTIKPWEATFEEAVLIEFSLTNRDSWENPYDVMALGKAKQAWRDGQSNVEKHLLAPATLKDGDVAFYGSFAYQGVIVAASGVEGWFDQLISGWMALTIQQLCQDYYQRFKLRPRMESYIS